MANIIKQIKEVKETLLDTKYTFLETLSLVLFSIGVYILSSIYSVPKEKLLLQGLLLMILGMSLRIIGETK